MDPRSFPTKGNLILAKNSLTLARQGYELMDKKRNILIRELMGLIDEAKDIQEEIDKTFTYAYQCLQRANIEHGISTVEELAYTVPIEDSIRIQTRSIMGTEIPKVKYEKENTRPTYAFSTSRESIDIARDAFCRVKELTLKLSEVENAAYRLASSIKKTQKRANALKNITIPMYDNLVYTITNALEEKEREKTGIKMKIGYTKVFGYYFEISHANTKPIPDYYVRKQTLVNAERYITPELKEFEVKVLTSQERMLALEYKLFGDIRRQIQGHIPAMQETARAIACIDCLYSLACAAYDNRYVRPSLNTKATISIKDGRHPIIEKYLKDELFVPNDVTLNHEDHEILVITGPNMAGKSTYMRQVAVLVLMAQAGSFIPAKEGSICPVDRIFTRIGASDDILTGQSTFMMEMKEVSYILKHATSRSLLILDEIGRGTSTFDGMSIARAVIEYCLKHIHALTLFATHYHELIAMADDSPKIKNYTVAVKERGKNIKFLRRIIPGGADRSYGLHVARLAGLPESLLKRADVILEDLEKNGGAPVPAKAPVNPAPSPMGDSLFSSPVIDKLLSVDVSSMTPIEAISFLYNLQKDAKEGSGIQ